MPRRPISFVPPGTHGEGLAHREGPGRVRAVLPPIDGAEAATALTSAVTEKSSESITRSDALERVDDDRAHPFAISAQDRGHRRVGQTDRATIGMSGPALRRSVLTSTWTTSTDRRARPHRTFRSTTASSSPTWACPGAPRAGYELLEALRDAGVRHPVRHLREIAPSAALRRSSQPRCGGVHEPTPGVDRDRPVRVASPTSGVAGAVGRPFPSQHIAEDSGSQDRRTRCSTITKSPTASWPRRRRAVVRAVRR